MFKNTNVQDVLITVPLKLRLQRKLNYLDPTPPNLNAKRKRQKKHSII